MVLNVEFLVEEMLYLLLFPRLALTQEFEKFFLFIFAELRGTSVPEVRRQLTESALIPALCPPASG
ncbi:hypothetical protein C445_11591 [Halobiforma lacisalsi AJ5]|uniref:Uncharacterized protein n=1 Tax=Natronobacterium lacisalsi AJ5 TaxID=358396 RepID=M0LEH1_NATLA|nr:hypothetical protein C445_11591 [Halobiforma lacisalsi AJ5]